MTLLCRKEDVLQYFKNIEAANN